MAIQYVFGTIGNAGMSFSEKKNSDLIKMYNYTYHRDDVVGYVEFQNLIEENCGITDSNVRMYFTFLFAHGFVNEYKNGAQITLSEVFTPLGKAFIKSIIIASKLQNEELKQKAQSIAKNIIALSLFNRKAQGKEAYYFDFLKYCIKYDTISLKEFNYMLYEREMQQTTDYIDSISEIIQQLRNGEIDFEFLQDRTNKQGVQVRKSFPDNTFNYTQSLLTEAGLVIEAGNNEYKINPNKAHIVLKLVEEA